MQEQQLMAMFVVSGSLGLQIAIQPLDYDWLNHMETLSLTSTSVTVIATLYSFLTQSITTAATIRSQPTLLMKYYQH
jgi:hypothetical protein